MTRLPRRFCLALAAISLLGGCQLPRGAANSGQVLAGSDSPQADFAVYPVTRDSLPALHYWPFNGSGGGNGWITSSPGPSSQIIEAGDVLSLVVWDSGENSLLTTESAKVVTLSNIVVSGDGSIFLPYVDKVVVAKQTPDAAREMIQMQMSAIIPAAQVQLSMVSGRQNSVDVVSGTTNPGSFPLPDRNYSVMSLLAQAGGVSESIRNPQVRLSRDGRLYGTSMARLLAEPALDTVLRGGDKVFVEDDARYFLSLGAAGEQAQVYFPTDRVSALDATALVGGVNASRGNPQGILILRTYRPSDIRVDDTGPTRDRVVFTLDLTNADGLFSAGQFFLQPKDLVFVTESPITSARTIFGLIGQVFGLVDNANSL